MLQAYYNGSEDVQYRVVPDPVSLVDQINAELKTGGLYHHFGPAGNDWDVASYAGQSAPVLYNWKGAAPAEVVAAFGSASPVQIAQAMDPNGPGNGSDRGGFLEGVLSAAGFAATASSLMGLDFGNLLSTFTAGPTSESLAVLAAPTGEGLALDEFIANALPAAAETPIVALELPPYTPPAADSLAEFASNAGAATEYSAQAPGLLAAPTGEGVALSEFIANATPTQAGGVLDTIRAGLPTAAGLKAAASVAGSVATLTKTAASIAQGAALSTKSAARDPFSVFGSTPPGGAGSVSKGGPLPTSPDDNGGPGTPAYAPWLVAGALLVVIYFVTTRKG